MLLVRTYCPAGVTTTRATPVSVAVRTLWSPPPVIQEKLAWVERTVAA